MSEPARVVGIDAGGTHSRAVVLDREGGELAVAQGGAGLVRAGQEREVAATLARLTREALAAPGGGGPGHTAAALVAGVAGAGHPKVRADLQARLEEEGVAGVVSVVTDLEVAFHDAFPTGPGIMVVIGTGSIAVARDRDGRETRVGGWGELLGDEGSGYALGLAALRSVARAADGRGPQTALTGIVLRVLEVAEPQGLIPWVGGATKSEVAALAPGVLEAAEAGDGVAGALQLEALEAIRLLLRVAAGEVGDEAEVALGGGLLLPGRPLRAAVETVAETMGLILTDREVRPERGAARMALDLLGSSTP